MARSHITLAALATAAVPGFDPVQAQAFSTGMHGDFFAAIVTDATGRELIVRVPNSAEAEAQLGAEKYALETMTEKSVDVLRNIGLYLNIQED